MEERCPMEIFTTGFVSWSYPFQLINHGKKREKGGKKDAENIVQSPFHLGGFTQSY